MDTKNGSVEINVGQTGYETAGKDYRSMKQTKKNIEAEVNRLGGIAYSKPKKASRKFLKKTADKLFSLYIRRLGHCELEGLDNVRCVGVLQCAHIETRGVYAIRWNPLNAICCCQGHHVFYTFHESKWQEMIKRYFPKKYKFYLRHKNDVNTEDYETTIERLKKL